jgi:hypothetical protein
MREYTPTQDSDWRPVLIEPTENYTDNDIQKEILLPEDEWIERMLS